MSEVLHHALAVEVPHTHSHAREKKLSVVFFPMVRYTRTEKRSVRGRGAARASAQALRAAGASVFAAVAHRRLRRHLQAAPSEHQPQQQAPQQQAPPLLRDACWTAVLLSPQAPLPPPPMPQPQRLRPQPAAWSRRAAACCGAPSRQTTLASA